MTLVDDPWFAVVVETYRSIDHELEGNPEWLSRRPWLPPADWTRAAEDLMSSADPAVVAAAVDMVSLVAETDRNTYVVSLLIRVARCEDDDRVRIATVRALDRAGGVRARRALRESFRDGSVAVRRAVARWVWDFDREDEDPGVLDLLVELSGDVDEVVRERATFALARISSSRSPAVFGVLWERFLDPDGRVRSEALAGLVLRGEESLHDELYAMIGREAEDEDQDIDALLEAAAVTGERRFLLPLEQHLAQARALSDDPNDPRPHLIRSHVSRLRASVDDPHADSDDRE